MTLDAKGELALTLLSTMVPQALYRVGKKTPLKSLGQRSYTKCLFHLKSTRILLSSALFAVPVWLGKSYAAI